MKRNKVIILASIIVGVLVLALGLTYAAITFNETKGNSKLVLGDIWMHYNESDTSINITDLMPSDEYTNDYFEFTIDGKNTYEKEDIWYEIVLSHGDYIGDDENRTIRIDDQLLKFKLVEVVDGSEVEIFNNRTYSDLTNKRIHVDTISSTDNNYSKTYRLYVRVAEYTTICGGDATDGCDYYLNPDSEYANFDWNKLFASIKVNVSGDFEEKSIETPGSCFTYEFIKIPNSIMATQDATDETTELYKCINYHEEHAWGLDDDSDWESYCRGTGRRNGLIFSDYLYNYSSAYDLIELSEINVIINNNDDNVKLTGYDSSCGADVVIPQKIDGHKISVIVTNTGCLEFYDTDSYFENTNIENIILQSNIKEICAGAFYGVGLKTIEMTNGVTTINENAFERNRLINIEIPDSVTQIDSFAFEYNQLKTVKIGSGIQYIGQVVFYKTSTSNPNLESITFTSKTCEEIKNITASNSSTTKYFPWLRYWSPYYEEGYKAKVYGTDGECVY